MSKEYVLEMWLRLEESLPGRWLSQNYLTVTAPNCSQPGGPKISWPIHRHPLTIESKINLPNQCTIYIDFYPRYNPLQNVSDREKYRLHATIHIYGICEDFELYTLFFHKKNCG